MLRDPGRFLPAIELMYLCLSLGFMGRYRQARGDGEFDQAACRDARRDRCPAQGLPIRTCRGAGAASRRRTGLPGADCRSGSSRPPRWRCAAGCSSGHRPSLNAASDSAAGRRCWRRRPRTCRWSRAPRSCSRCRRRLHQPNPAIVDRLRAILQPEIDRGLVSLLGTAATPIIRIADHAMFASGSAAVQPAAVPLLERIGAALKDRAGIAAGDRRTPTTNRSAPCSSPPTSSSRPHAPRPCARSSRAASATPARVSAEGRADADPIAPNTTAEGREQNRRIEIVLRRQD